MIKKFAMFFLMGIISLSLAHSAMAECSGSRCPFHGKYAGSYEGKEKYQCPIVSKLMKKAHFFLENQKEIGLSEDQVNAIKAIKIDAKKAYIRQEAEMKIFHMDLDQKLSEPKVDVGGVNAMVDSAAAGFTASAKVTLASYVKLKSVLKEDQMAKAKDLWSQKKSGHSHH